MKLVIRQEAVWEDNPKSKTSLGYTEQAQQNKLETHTFAVDFLS